MNQDPSVLDFIKGHINTWWHNIFNPSADKQATEESKYWAEQVEGQSVQTSLEQTSTKSFLFFPWRVLLVLGLGLMGQLALEPRPGVERAWQVGVFLYVFAVIVLIWANVRNEWTLPGWDEVVRQDSNAGFLQSSGLFIISLVLTLITFAFLGGNRFTPFNVTVWLIALALMVRAFWIPNADQKNWFAAARDFLAHSRWSVSLERSALPLLAIVLLVIFFRVHRLADIPSQMISDHAEKLFDVGDVLNGQTSIFFPRNTGREFFQFYLTAGIILLFNTGLTFLSLKIGTVAAGLVALYYIYRLGVEIGNRRVGLFALAFAGIAYWPNVISRYGLRFPLYPLFYAPALFYLVRGLRWRNRNDFLLSGLFVGLGLQGYSPSRVVPLIILLAIGLYLLHSQSKGFRMQTLWGLIALGVVALIVFTPLLRYMIEHPNDVLFRGLTRIGDAERPLPGPALQIFISNLWNALIMFGWDNGEIWPHSIPHRPALDAVTAVLFHLGVVLVAIRYIRQRHWLDIFVLLSIPMLMLPSILSLAFPAENPSLNRTAGAIVPVFLIVGLSLDSLLTALEPASMRMGGKRLVWAVGLFLLAWASWLNYDLFFNQYRKQYDLSSWNTSELGGVVRDFANLTGSSETAWLVGYPYWVDSRLVMINAGFPMRDNAIWPESFKDTLADPRPKLFLVNINDLPDIETLQSLYPQGTLMEYQSRYENKNFKMFIVPAQ
jgi:hypothetical protein